MSEKPKEFKGTAQDIGCDVFLQNVLPIIRLASKKMPPRELAELYAGFMAGFAGAMAADFGKDVSQSLIASFVRQLDNLFFELDQGLMQ